MKVSDIVDIIFGILFICAAFFMIMLACNVAKKNGQKEQLRDIIEAGYGEYYIASPEKPTVLFRYKCPVTASD